jgi:hypothetical protein
VLAQLTGKALADSAVGAFMALPLLGTIGIPGSELLPPPDATRVLFVAIFAAYIALGMAWLLLQRTRRPHRVLQMVERARERSSPARESFPTQISGNQKMSQT